VSRYLHGLARIPDGRIVSIIPFSWQNHSQVDGNLKLRYSEGKPEGKRPLARPRRRWVDNIRLDFQEVGCWYMDWIGLAQDRDRWRTLVGAVMNLGVP